MFMRFLLVRRRVFSIIVSPPTYTPREASTSGTGRTTSHMATALIRPTMEPNTSVNTRTANAMAKALRRGPVETITSGGGRVAMSGKVSIILRQAK